MPRRCAAACVVGVVSALHTAALFAAPPAKPNAAKPLTEPAGAPAPKLAIPVQLVLTQPAIVSADGKWVLAADQSSARRGVTVFDASSGAKVREIVYQQNDEPLAIYQVALSADGRVLAMSAEQIALNSAQQKSLKVFDFATGRERWALSGFKHPATNLSLSADGRWLSSGTSHLEGSAGASWSGEFRLWDLTTGKATISVDQAPGYQDCCVSAGGKHFLWLAGKAWHVYDTATGKETAVVPSPVKEIQRHVRIAPDGQTMVTAGEHMAVVWDFPARKFRKLIPNKPIGGGLACFTSDSKQFALPMYERVVFFDAASGNPIGSVTAAAKKYVPRITSMSGDGKTFATTAVDRVRLFDASKLEPPPTLPPAPDPLTAAQIGFPDVESEAGKPAKPPPPSVPNTGVPPNVAVGPSVPAVPPVPRPGVPATKPPAVQPGDSGKPPPTAVPPPPADPATLEGKWTTTEAGFDVTLTIVRSGQAWQVSIVYRKGGAEAGAAHGENVQLAGGTLTFIRAFDKKPSPAFATTTTCTVELKDGRLSYVSSTGKRTTRLTFDRVKR